MDKLIKLVLLFLLVCTPAMAGTGYFIDPMAGNDSWDGLSPSFVSGTNGPWKSCTPEIAKMGGGGVANSYGNPALVGADLYIYGGTTLNCGLIFNVSGTPSDFAEITSYNKGYIGLAKPVIDGASVQAGPWSRYLDTAIYSATNTAATTHVVTVNNSRLREIAWDTNIATTAAKMAAGSYTLSDTDDLLYVWTSDSTDPTSKTVEYASVTSNLHSHGYTDERFHWQYQYVHGLQFRRANAVCAVMSEYYEVYENDYSKFEDNDITMCGSAGARIGGNNFIAKNNTCSDSNSETLGDSACIVIDGGGGTVGHYSTNMEVSYNTVSGTRNGSCFEMNFGIQDSRFHHNIGTNCTHQFLEIWSTTTKNNRVYSNKGDSSALAICPRSGTTPYDKYHGDTCRVDQGSGMKIANGPSFQYLYNNKLIGFLSSGIKVGRSYEVNANKNNYAFNNTIIAPDGYPSSRTSARGCLAVGSDNSSLSEVGNTFWNNACYIASGRFVYDDADNAGGNYWDYNSYYQYGTTGEFALYDGTTYATFADYKAGTGQDSHSVNSDPLLDVNYDISVGSPLIGKAQNLSYIFTDDYSGNLRAGLWDIGASQSLKGTKFNHVNMNRVNAN